MSEQDDADGPDDGSDGLPLTRRQFGAAAAGTVVGGTAGAFYVFQSQGPKTVKPQSPNDDGEASLGELYWLLENNGPEKSRLQVEECLYYPGDDVVDLTYRSAARTEEKNSRVPLHVEEVGQVIQQFAIYVESDGKKGKEKGTRLEAHVENRFSKPSRQPEGYHVERSWVKKMLSGQWTKKQTLQRVLQTGYVNGTTK